jgi:hypothetical protein
MSESPTIVSIVPVCFVSDGTARQVLLSREQYKLVEMFVVSLFDGEPVKVLTDELPLQVEIREKPKDERA